MAPSDSIEGGVVGCDVNRLLDPTLEPSAVLVQHIHIFLLELVVWVGDTIWPDFCFRSRHDSALTKAFSSPKASCKLLKLLLSDKFSQVDTITTSCLEYISTSFFHLKQLSRSTLTTLFWHNTVFKQKSEMTKVLPDLPPCGLGLWKEKLTLMLTLVFPLFTDGHVHAD